MFHSVEGQGKLLLAVKVPSYGDAQVIRTARARRDCGEMPAKGRHKFHL
jgi:predicted kinase